MCVHASIARAWVRAHASTHMLCARVWVPACARVSAHGTKLVCTYMPCMYVQLAVARASHRACVYVRMHAPTLIHTVVCSCAHTYAHARLAVFLLQVSEHACWSSGYYGRLIRACLEAAGAPTDLVGRARQIACETAECGPGIQRDLDQTGYLKDRVVLEVVLICRVQVPTSIRIMPSTAT
eukprot:4693355-Pleurochrysis_carterae.AAC.1